MTRNETSKRSKRYRVAMGKFVREAIRSRNTTAVILALPDEQPMRRDLYLAINTVAYSLLGSGNYYLTAPPDKRSALLSWDSP